MSTPKYRIAAESLKPSRTSLDARSCPMCGRQTVIMWNGRWATHKIQGTLSSRPRCRMSNQPVEEPRLLEPAPVTAAREWCDWCDRVVATRTNGRLVRHKVRPGGNWCTGSGVLQPKVQASNDTGAVTGGHFGGLVRPTELERWWQRISQQDLAMLLPKVREYSAYDMVLIGKATADMVGFDRGWDDQYGEAVPDGVYAEIGCWWYLLGKVGRAIGAIKEGRLPSEDTAMDTHVYAMMVRRIKATGAWPGHIDEYGDDPDPDLASAFGLQDGDDPDD